MEGAHIEPVALERAEDDAHILLAVAEDDGVVDVVFSDQAAQGFTLLGRAIDGLLETLRDGRCRRGRPGDFDSLRGMKEVVREALNFRRHGRGKEERLPGEGEDFADAFDIGDEAHIEHPVGLVDHENLDAVQQELAAFEMIEKAAWCGDHHIGATVQLLVLLLVGDAADQQRDGQLVVFAEKLEGLGDLGGEFARGFQDQRAGHSGAGASTFEARQHWKHERGGLACACLRNA